MPDTGGGSSNGGGEETIPLLPNPKLVAQITNQLNDAFGEGNWDNDLRDEIMDLINNDSNVDTMWEAVDKIITDDGPKGIKNVHCLMDIFNSLGNSQEFQPIINNLDNEFSLLDTFLYFENNTANIPDFDTASAITRRDGSDRVQIIFNTDPTHDYAMSYIPDAFRVSVFVHELIHAHIYLKLRSSLGMSYANYTEQELDIYLLQKEYNTLFELYQNTFSNGTDAHHEYMSSTEYFDLIKNTLLELFPNLSQLDAETIAWSGLTGNINTFNPNSGTEAWQELSPTTKSYIFNNWNYLFNNLTTTGLCE